MSSPVSKWIADRVHGLSFCDIGGIGINSANERISGALAAGASRATMIDFRGFEHHEWGTFRRIMAEKGISQYEEVEKANLEDANFPSKIGQYDFVYSTGIIYHCPAPVLILNNLRKITRKYLITNTIIVPDFIENEEGALHTGGSSALFLPGLDRKERRVMQRYFADKLGWSAKKFDDNIPDRENPRPMMPFVQWELPASGVYWSAQGELSYSPYWWMFTERAFEGLVELFRLRIVERSWFKDHALTVLCEPVT